RASRSARRVYTLPSREPCAGPRRLRGTMARTIWLAANTISYPRGGGHLWVYLNWALGLQALGCRVIWLEIVSPAWARDDVPALVAQLRQRLEQHGLRDGLALGSTTGQDLPAEWTEGCTDLEAARGADLLLNMSYDKATAVLGRCRRSALIDID